jgi:hypothetical protein
LLTALSAAALLSALTGLRLLLTGLLTGLLIALAALLALLVVLICHSKLLSEIW